MKKIVAILMVVLMLILNFNMAFASDIRNSTFNTVLQKASSLLSYIEQNKTFFELDDVDFSKIYLAEPLSIFDNVDGVLSATSEQCYPVVDETGNVIAVILSKLENGEPILSFSTAEAPVVEQYCLNGEEEIIRIGDEFIAADATGKENVSLVQNAVPITVTNSNARSSGITIPVYDYKQGSGENTCWACCTVSVGNYFEGYHKYSYMDIVNQYGIGGTAVGMPFITVRGALIDLYGIYSVITYGSLPYSDAATNIMNGKPLITSTLLQNGFHAIVVCGYYSDAYTKYITYMNPTLGSKVTLEIIGSDVYYRSTNGSDYDTTNYMQLL